MLCLAFAIFGQRAPCNGRVDVLPKHQPGRLPRQDWIPRPSPTTFISTCIASPYHLKCTIQATLAAPEVTGISYQFFFAIAMDRPHIVSPHTSNLHSCMCSWCSAHPHPGVLGPLLVGGNPQTASSASFPRAPCTRLSYLYRRKQYSLLYHCHYRGGKCAVLKTG